MKRQLAPLAVAALLSAGCGASGAPAPWLTAPDANQHQKHFPIAPGDTHGPLAGQAAADCNGCHYDKAKAAPSASFKVFTCTGCHDVMLKSGIEHGADVAIFSAWHNANGVTGANGFDATVASANTLGYAAGVGNLDAACHHCHQNGIGVDHAARFVLPHQDAAGTVVARCADCHVVPGDRTQLGCSSCHPHDLVATETGHALVPDFVKNGATPAGIQAASVLCARCHEDGKIPVAVASHAAGAKGFTIGNGAHSGRAGGACLSCHAQNKTTAPRTFVADFKVSTCVGCHVTVGGTAFHDDQASLATLHSAVPDFAATVTAKGSLSAACLSCHVDGGAGAPANHELLFPRGIGTKHAGIACASCHTNPANRKDLTAFACASCHAALTGPPTLTAAHSISGYTITSYRTATTAGGTRTTVQVNMAGSQSCLRCHADSQVDRVAAHPQGESGFGKSDHRVAGCFTCHSKLRTDKPWGSNFKEARGSAGPPPSGCYVCHASGSG